MKLPKPTTHSHAQLCSTKERKKLPPCADPACLKKPVIMSSDNVRTKLRKFEQVKLFFETAIWIGASFTVIP